MVVRLGVSSDVQVVNSQRFRVLQGQALQLRYASSETVAVRAWARVRYDNGEDDVLFIADQTLNNDRVAAVARPSDVARLDGWVTDALVELPNDATIKRGQVYVKLFFDPFGPVLCADYVYSEFGSVSLGTYIQSGPGGGSGNLRIVTVRFDGTPTSNFAISLAASNTVRKLHAFYYYFHASNDVATRVINVALRDELGLVPTGWTGTGPRISWATPTLTLTADQEGIVFADAKRSGQNDTSVVTIENAASAPSPFPLLILQDDTGDLLFNITDGEALDLDALYFLREEWVMLN